MSVASEPDGFHVPLRRGGTGGLSKGVGTFQFDLIGIANRFEMVALPCALFPRKKEYQRLQHDGTVEVILIDSGRERYDIAVTPAQPK